MGETTAIAWTDHTFNPWWGCARVSPGCANCYAEALAKRYGHDVWGKSSPRRMLSDQHWREPLQCAAAAVPYFFKQVGGHHATTGGDLLDDVTHKAFPPEAMR